MAVSLYVDVLSNQTFVVWSYVLIVDEMLDVLPLYEGQLYPCQECSLRE